LWAATKLFEASLKNYIFPAAGDRRTKNPKAVWDGQDGQGNGKWEMGNVMAKWEKEEVLAV